MTALLALAGALLLAASLTPLLPARPNLLVDLPSHFIAQYALAAAALVPLSVFFGATPALLLTAAALCLGLIHLFPFLPVRRRAPQAPALKILQANLLKTNSNTALFQALIAQEKPDIIACAEVSPPFAEMLRSLADYPHRLFAERPDYGMAVLSRLPLREAESVVFPRSRAATLFFTVEHDGADIRCASLHPVTPLADIVARDGDFGEVVRRLTAEAPRRLILMGDFNATPWCPALRQLMRALGLHHARRGHGVKASWPATWPAFLRLPIDHVLASPDLEAAEFRLGPAVGSDHLPTITRIVLRKG